MATWIAGSCWRLPSAHADEAAASADSTASADALIQKGIDLRKAGEDRQALAEFERAFSLYGSVRALAQMALAEQALGLWREAHEHLQRALLTTDDPWIEEHRATLDAAAGEIASQLGSLEISCNVAGAAVRLNGVVLGLTPLSSPVPLVAGANVIVVSKPGFFEMVRQVNIDAGRLSRLNVVLTPGPTESPVPPTAWSHPRAGSWFYRARERRLRQRRRRAPTPQRETYFSTLRSA
jgi:tetratricopeptide (TPR) repeat protein